MQFIPFTTIHAALGFAFSTGLSDTLNSVLAVLSGPLTACVTLWIIVQGMLVMRGDLDARKGVVTIVKHAIIFLLLTSAIVYETYVKDTFVTTLPNMITGLVGGPAAYVGIPASLDAMLLAIEKQFQYVARDIGPQNFVDAENYANIQTVFFGVLLTTFTTYEVADIMLSVLVVIGPLLIVGLMFEATKNYASQWIGQLVNYTVLFLLMNLVATIVVGAEGVYVTAQLAAMALNQQVSAKILNFYEMGLFLGTGEAIIITLPVMAAVISGGFNGPGSNPGARPGGPLGGRVARPQVPAGSA